MTMEGLNFFMLLLFVGSNNATSFRNLAKSIMVGSILDTYYMNDPHIYNITGTEFNLLTSENEMKWGILEPVRGKPNYDKADAIVKYAEKFKMKIRGHNLIWHQQLPDWLTTLNKTELYAAMVARIKDIVTRYKGKIYAWDVVNEVVDGNGLRDSIWSKNFGETFISEAFRLAKKIDPSSKMYINEYSVETNKSRTVFLYKLVKKLKAQGVPIDGVGIQCHLSAGSVPSSLGKIMKWFISLGVEVAVTELSLEVKTGGQAELQQQAKDYANIYKTCEDIKQCVSVTVWGTSDKFSWKKSAKPSLWDENFNPKPAVAAVRAVLH